MTCRLLPLSALPAALRTSTAGGTQPWRVPAVGPGCRVAACGGCRLAACEGCRLAACGGCLQGSHRGAGQAAHTFHTPAPRPASPPLVSLTPTPCAGPSSPLPPADDFYPTDRASHIPHLAACAFNALFLSPLALPGARRLLLRVVHMLHCASREQGLWVCRLLNFSHRAHPQLPTTCARAPLPCPLLQTGTCSAAGTWRRTSTPPRAPSLAALSTCRMHPDRTGKEAPAQRWRRRTSGGCLIPRMATVGEPAPLGLAAGPPTPLPPPPAPPVRSFDVLRKLVLPDGSVLRGLLPGRPTRDTLFADVLRDGTSLLKVGCVASIDVGTARGRTERRRRLLAWRRCLRYHCLWPARICLHLPACPPACQQRASASA